MEQMFSKKGESACLMGNVVDGKILISVFSEQNKIMFLPCIIFNMNIMLRSLINIIFPLQRLAS